MCSPVGEHAGRPTGSWTCMYVEEVLGRSAAQGRWMGCLVDGWIKTRVRASASTPWLAHELARTRRCASRCARACANAHSHS
eukprot:6173939-Pleurochrysis_carterae.AAC.4